MNTIRLNFIIVSYAFFLLLIFIIGAYSPLLGFYIGLLSLLIPGFENRSLRVPICLIAIFFLSYIVASRNIHTGDIRDDFERIYYPLYIKIKNGATIFNPEFSGGTEFLLPLIFKVIYLTLGSIKASTLMAVVSFISYVLFYIWLELFGLQSVDKTKRAFCVACALGFMIAVSSTQIMRQFISSVLMLYAVSTYYKRQYKTFLIFLFMASVCHLSALVLTPLYILLMSSHKRYKKILIVTLIVFSVMFSLIVSFAITHNLLGIATYKLMFYMEGDSTQDIVFTRIKYLIVAIFLGLLWFSSNNDRYKSLLYYGTLSYIIMMPIPVVSDRVFFLLSYILLGYMYFLSTVKVTNLFKCIFIVYCGFRIYQFAMIYSGSAYQNYSGDFIIYWSNYPWSGNSFLYFM